MSCQRGQGQSMACGYIPQIEELEDSDDSFVKDNASRSCAADGWKDKGVSTDLPGMSHSLPLEPVCEVITAGANSDQQPDSVPQSQRREGNIGLEQEPSTNGTVPRNVYQAKDYSLKVEDENSHLDVKVDDVAVTEQPGSVNINISGFKLHYKQVGEVDKQEEQEKERKISTVNDTPQIALTVWEDALRPIEGVCTQQILKRDREKNIGSYSHDEPNTLADDLKFMADHLSINSEWPETKIFSDNISSFVKTIATSMCGSEKPFTLSQCGSFPANLKVKDLDEFDFFLTTELEEPRLFSTGIVGLLQKALAGNRQLPISSSVHGGVLYAQLHLDDHLSDWENKLYERIHNIDLPRYTVERYNQGKVCIGQLFKHGPALCIKLVWKCHQGHDHETGIDMTLICSVQGRMLREVWTPPPWFFNEPFSSIRDELLDSPLCVTYSSKRGKIYKCKVSFNVKDSLVFGIADTVSPNIKRLYILLKHIRDRIIPNQLRLWKRNAEAGQTAEQLCSDQLVSSYMIKCLLLHEVVKNPSPDQWEDERIPERLGDLLMLLWRLLAIDSFSWQVCKYQSFYVKGICTKMTYDTGNAKQCYNETQTEVLLQSVLFQASEDLSQIRSNLAVLATKNANAASFSAFITDNCRDSKTADDPVANRCIYLVSARKSWMCCCSGMDPYCLHKVDPYLLDGVGYRIDSSLFSVDNNGKCMYYYKHPSNDSEFLLDQICGVIMREKLRKHQSSAPNTKLYLWLLSRRWISWSQVPNYKKVTKNKCCWTCGLLCSLCTVCCDDDCCESCTERTKEAFSSVFCFPCCLLFSIRCCYPDWRTRKDIVEDDDSWGECNLCCCWDDEGGETVETGDPTVTKTEYRMYCCCCLSTDNGIGELSQI